MVGAPARCALGKIFMSCTDQTDTQPHASSGSADGEAVQSNPESSEAPEQGTEMLPIPLPIGMPVSPDEYRQRKGLAELPDKDGEEASQEDIFEDALQAIPLGFPVSPDEYQQLKRRAEQPDEEESTDDAAGEAAASIDPEVEQEEE